MKQSKAREHLEHMMICIQKARSNANLDLEEKYIQLLPNNWLFGEKCPLPALQKILDRNEIVAQDFYNMMFIAYKFIPELSVPLALLGFEQLPEPDINWLRGWENES